MTSKELTKLDIAVIIIFILSIGAYLGVSYSDNQWKYDLVLFSHENVNFYFDKSDNYHYYTIQQHNLTNYKFIDILNDSKFNK